MDERIRTAASRQGAAKAAAIGSLSVVLACLSCATTGSTASPIGSGRAVHHDLTGAPVLAEAPFPKPRLLVAWSSWCPPCRAEQPHIARVRAQYLGRLDVVGLNFDPDREDARAYAQKSGIQYPSIWDPKWTAAEQHHIETVPALVLLDTDGRVVHRAGSVDDALRAAITTLIGAPTP